MLTKEKVEDLLFGFGIAPNLKGFQYIVDAVMQYESNKPFTNLYIDVAKMHKTTYAGVERSIRHAFLRLDFQDEKVSDFFGDTKRTNSELIATIYLKLSRKGLDKVPTRTDMAIIKRFKDIISEFEEELDKLLEEVR